MAHAGAGGAAKLDGISLSAGAAGTCGPGSLRFTADGVYSITDADLNSGGCSVGAGPQPRPTLTIVP